MHPSESPEKKASLNILKSIERGDIIGIVPSPVLSEFYYQVSDMAPYKRSHQTAYQVIQYFLQLYNLEIFAPDEETAIESGVIYFKYNSVNDERGFKRLPTKEERAHLIEGGRGFLSIVDCIVIGTGIRKNTPVCTNDEDMFISDEITIKKPSDMWAELETDLQNGHTEVEN